MASPALGIFRLLDRRVANDEFVAGPNYSIADISAFIAVDWAKRIKLDATAGSRGLGTMAASVSARPNASV